MELGCLVLFGFLSKSNLALNICYFIISGNIFDNFRPMCAAAVAALRFIRTTISWRGRHRTVRQCQRRGTVHFPISAIAWCDKVDEVNLNSSRFPKTSILPWCCHSRHRAARPLCLLGPQLRQGKGMPRNLGEIDMKNTNYWSHLY